MNYDPAPARNLNLLCSCSWNMYQIKTRTNRNSSGLKDTIKYNFSSVMFHPFVQIIEASRSGTRLEHKLFMAAYAES